MKTGGAFCQCRSNYRPLGKALGHRHDQGLRRVNELEVAICSLAHFIRRPLARSGGLIGTEGRICIRSTIFQTIQTRLTACLAHAERNEVDVLGLGPFVQRHDPLDILRRMRRGHKLDDVGTMVLALLHQRFERLV